MSRFDKLSMRYFAYLDSVKYINREKSDAARLVSILFLHAILSPFILYNYLKDSRTSPELEKTDTTQLITEKISQAVPVEEQSTLPGFYKQVKPKTLPYVEYLPYLIRQSRHNRHVSLISATVPQKMHLNLTSAKEAKYGKCNKMSARLAR